MDRNKNKAGALTYELSAEAIEAREADFEGRRYRHVGGSAFDRAGFGAEWRDADGRVLYLGAARRGSRVRTVRAFEFGKEQWCTLVEAIDGRRVAPVYGRKDEDISIETLRRWIAGA
jgi:hypothetical protein